MAKQQVLLVRPNLGRPLVVTAAELSELEVTVAATWLNYEHAPGQWRQPSVQDITDLVTADAPRLLLHKEERTVPLHVLGASAHGKRLYPEWSPLAALRPALGALGLPASCEGVDQLLDLIDRRDPRVQKWDVTALRKLCVALPLPDEWPDHYHAASGFRWECGLRLGLDPSLIQTLSLPSIASIQLGDRVNRHAVYVTARPADPRKSRFIHMTDSHVSFRNDKIPALVGAGESDRIEKWRFLARYTNFNDSLRLAIKYANFRAARGELDFIVLTGDIIDYGYDSRWLTAGNAEESNFRAFARVITGEDGQGERLQVPLYIVPGNHEYYRYLTPLMAHVDPDAEKDLPWYYWLFPPLGAVLYGVAAGMRQDKNTFADFGFQSTSADKKRARRVDSHYDVPETVGLDAAKALWARFGHFAEYLKTIAYDLDYQLTHGPNRFLCLNTGALLGAPETKDDYINPRTPAQKHFVSGHPDTRGITDYQLSQTLKISPASTGGRVFAFSHAPFILMHAHSARDLKLPITEGAHEHAPAPPNMVTAWLGFVQRKVVRITQPLRQEQLEKLRTSSFGFAGPPNEQWPDNWRKAHLLHCLVSERLGRVDQACKDSIAEDRRIFGVLRDLDSRILQQIKRVRRDFPDMVKVALDGYDEIRWWDHSEAAHLGWDPPLSTLVDELRQQGYPQAGTKYFHHGGWAPLLDFGAATGRLGDFLSKVVGERTGKKVDVLFSGHTHAAHEYRLSKNPENFADYRVHTLDYSKQGWWPDWTPIFVTSGSLKGANPCLREVEVTPDAVRFRLHRFRGSHQAVPAGIEHLFAALSVRLARRGGFANPARNDLNPCTHVAWARGTLSRRAVMIDLGEKCREHYRSLGERRAQLVEAYTSTTLWLNSLGLDFGYPARNSMDATVHRPWAHAARIEELCEETEHRIECVFDAADRCKKDNHNLLAMWFAAESFELASVHTFNHAWRDSRVPATHYQWALSVSGEQIIRDLQEKYELVFEAIEHPTASSDSKLHLADLRTVASFYARSAARLAEWGPRCGETGGDEPAEARHFTALCASWTNQAIRADLHARLAVLGEKLSK